MGLQAVLVTTLKFLDATLATMAIETAVLVAGLSYRHRISARVFAGIWLSACTLPIAWLVLPWFFLAPGSDGAYVVTAESFAVVAECCLFWVAFVRPKRDDIPATIRDVMAILAANMLSYAAGEFILAT